MKLDRRQLLAGSAALALLPSKAEAWFPHGSSGSIPIGHGWNTLPLGAGGNIDGLHIATDGSMVCRGDVFGAFVWSGTSALSSITDPTQKWTQVNTLASFGITAGTEPGGFAAYPYEYVQAPGNSNYHYLLNGSNATGSKFALYYSTNKGTNWTESNVLIPPPSAGLAESYKIAADPNNEKIVYFALPSNGGLSAGVYTTFDRSLANTWPTFNAATTDGSTLFPNCTVATGGGIAFDTSMGTTTVNGQLVTKRIILCVGGSGIYESTDGGQNWTEIAVSAFGSSAFHVVNGFFDGNYATNINSVNNYFCTVPELNKLYRYVGGGTSGWKNITPATFEQQIIVDPRAGQTYITAYYGNGIGVGYTTTNSTATTPTWGGGTGGQTTNLRGASYDLPYLNYIFGQTGYAEGQLGIIDQNGTCLWCGNQSIWYFTALPNYSVSTTTTSYSFGRGQEGTVSCDVLEVPGASFPILACQDLGAPMIGNTFTAYPTDMVQRGKEYLASSLEYAASDSNFIVARMTGQFGTSYDVDISSYSPDKGVTWNGIAGVPTALWQSVVTGSITGTVLTATSFVSGNIIFPNTLVYIGNTYYGLVQPYGTGGTTGTGGAAGATYSLSASSSASGNFVMTFQPASGQTVAVDHDHWVTVPTGQDGQYSIPAYTTNATTTASWALCQQGGGGNMPAARWSASDSWQGGDSPKVMAVGYGADLGTVWIGQWDNVGHTVTLWRATDSGATFSTITSAVACNPYGTNLYVLSVPGYPNELWVGVAATGGSGNLLWHVTNANTSSATMTPMTGTNLPSTRTLLHAFTLGAPASPGGYPLLYGTFEPPGFGTVPSYLYQGVWSGTTLTWSLYGPSGASQGAQQQLPKSFGLNGIGHLRGSWNVSGRIFTTNNGMGFAYYNP